MMRRSFEADKAMNILKNNLLKDLSSNVLKTSNIINHSDNPASKNITK